jgi:hypothetical protein
MASIGAVTIIELNTKLKMNSHPKTGIHFVDDYFKILLFTTLQIFGGIKSQRRCP